MTTVHVLGTLAAVLVFGSVFLRGRRVRLLGLLGPRTVASLGGGAAVAYVFLDLSPELHEAADYFRQEMSRFALRIFDYGIHLSTMSGFLAFYGLDVLVIGSRDEAERQRRREATHVHPMFRVHVGAFAAYAWLVSYLLVRSLQQTAVSLTFYAIAMGLHFLGVERSLREEHGALYDRIGGPLLAASCVAGWISGLVIELPGPVLGVLLGIVAGGIIANTVISEIPREREGRFVPFVVGAAAYSGLLLLARQG